MRESGDQSENQDSSASADETSEQAGERSSNEDRGSEGKKKPLKKKIKISLKDLTRTEKIMRCFSAQRNLKKLFSERKYDVEEEEFEMINAVKLIAISIIVMGNTWYYVMSGPLRNLEIISEWMNDFLFTFIIKPID